MQIHLQPATGNMLEEHSKACGRGFVLVGPALHYWYNTLGRVVTATGSSGATPRTDSSLPCLRSAEPTWHWAKVQGDA